jgi:hypothetical protein
MSNQHRSAECSLRRRLRSADHRKLSLKCAADHHVIHAKHHQPVALFDPGPRCRGVEREDPE